MNQYTIYLIRHFKKPNSEGRRAVLLFKGTIEELRNLLIKQGVLKKEPA